MLTVDQIKAAHSKVKSGADFPAYIREIKALGVQSYHTYVTDGHTDYYGANDYTASTQPRYDAIVVANTCNKDQFVADLKAHQQGKSDYPSFIDSCAKYGVDKWIVDMAAMTCTYYDKAGNTVLTEHIPQ